MQKIVNGQPVQMTQAEIDEHNARTPPVPASVTPRQMRLALVQSNLMAQVNAHVATLSEPVKIEWEYAIAVDRGSPAIAAAASQLGLNQSQVDDLFRLAASL